MMFHPHLLSLIPFPAGFNNENLANEFIAELGEFPNFNNFLGQFSA